MSFLSSFFKKESSVLGIDIGSSAIKVVQIKKKRGRAVLETYGELALGPYAGIEVGRAASVPADKIIEAIKDILRESKTTKKYYLLLGSFAYGLLCYCDILISPSVNYLQQSVERKI